MAITLTKEFKVVIVMLQPGIHLNLRLLRVVLVLGFLLLPPVMQICGKRVFRVM